MRRKKMIRSSVGPTGMLIYTPDQKQVCIAYNVNGNHYTLRNEPAFFWDGQEELFRLTYFDEYTRKESIFLFVRLIIEFMVVGFLPYFLQNHISTRQLIGLTFFLFSMIYIFEFAILKGIQRRKSKKGLALLRWQGALNKAINAYEKTQKAPSLKEVQNASIYRKYKDDYEEPNEVAGVIFFFISVSFFMPTVLLQIISIPILIYLTLYAYKTSFFGILRCTYAIEPPLYEMQMACDLIDFWLTISNSNTPIPY